MHNILRYYNRKLYSKTFSKYVNIDELTDIFITSPEDVYVTNYDGKDLTGEYMLMCIANIPENAQNVDKLDRILREQRGLL